MKKLLLLFVLFAPLSSVNAHVLEEAWEKYSSLSQSPLNEEVKLTPGELLGRSNGQDAFEYPWKYRAKTYEMHFADPRQLARGLYSMALFVGDISNDLPREKFYSGVTGFHYSASQIADWLNWAIQNHIALNEAESEFAGKMLANGIIMLGKNGFEATGAIHHVLGAANGKKRTFEQNLLHERLHVFWDEDKDFQNQAMTEWNSLSGEEKENIRKMLKNYNQQNEAQLTEEWAISNAEKANPSIK